MKSRLRKLLRLKQNRNKPDGPVRQPTPQWNSPDPTLTASLMDHLDPALIDALQHHRIDEFANRVGPGLWTLPFFTESGCERLAAVIDHRLKWQQDHPQESPNSMHYSGVVFGPMGLAPTMTQLRTQVVDPLRAVLYTEFDTLDDDYAFAATYGHRLDHRLGFHVDDSEVTLNVSLGNEYTGGEVVFQGRRCPLHRQEPHRPEEEFSVTVPKGHGLLHTGSHRHLVNAVMGERRNLILWCRSSQSRAKRDESTCPTWCDH